MDGDDSFDPESILKEANAVLITQAEYKKFIERFKNKERKDQYKTLDQFISDSINALVSAVMGFAYITNSTVEKEQDWIIATIIEQSREYLKLVPREDKTRE